MQRLWVPQEMSLPPRLDPELRTSRVRPRYALLINPFYPKDPHASFGKHVLVPVSHFPIPRGRAGDACQSKRRCENVLAKARVRNFGIKRVDERSLSWPIS